MLRGTLLVVILMTVQESRSIQVRMHGISMAVLPSAGDHAVLFGWDGNACVVRLKGLVPSEEFALSSQGIACAVALDGNEVVLGGVAGRITVADILLRKPLRELDVCKGQIRSVAFARRGERIVVLDSERTVQLVSRDCRTVERLSTRTPVPPAFSVAICDSGLGVIGCADGTAIIYDFCKMSEVRTITGLSGTCEAVGVSADGKTWVVTSSEERKGARLHNIKPGDWIIERAVQVTKEGIRSMCISPEGKRVYSGDLGGVVWVTDLHTGESRVVGKHGDQVTCVVSTERVTLSFGLDRVMKLYSSD